MSISKDASNNPKFITKLIVVVANPMKCLKLNEDLLIYLNNMAKLIIVFNYLFKRLGSYKFDLHMLKILIMGYKSRIERT